MSQEHSRGTPTGQGPRPQEPRWAPWWVYLIVLLGANYLRASLLPGDVFPTAVTVAIAAAQAAVLFTIVTIVWRVSTRSSS